MPEIHCSKADPLTGSCAQPPPTGLQALQISVARLRNPLLNAYLRGNKEEALKEPFWNIYHTLQAMLAPWALIH